MIYQNRNKDGTGIYRTPVSKDKLVLVPDCWRPVIRSRRGWAIYYRWNWWGILDWKLKTVWLSKFKDWEI